MNAKKILSLLLAVLMAAAIAPFSIFADDAPDTTYNTLVSEKATAANSTGTVSNSGLLNDGDKTGAAVSTAYTPNGYVTLDLGSSEEISKVIAYTPADDKNGYGIYGSNDGTNWTELGIKELSTAKSYEVTVGDSYRYIKLLHMEGRPNTDKYVGVGELEVYAADGETNLALSATTTTYNAVYSGDIVKDGTGADSYVNCCWLNPAKPAFVTMDLKKITPVNSITVYPKNESNATLIVSTSMNNSTFTEYGRITLSDDYDGSGYTLQGDTTTRFVKIEYVGNSTSFDLYEVEVRAELTKKEMDEQELTQTLTAPIVKADGTKLPNANNGNLAGSYSRLPEGENCYMIIDLEAKYELTKLFITLYNGNYEFTIYGSNDKEEWTEITESAAGDALRIIELSGTYRYLKVVGTKCQYSWFTFYEVDVYGIAVPDFISGDVDGDGEVTIQDVTRILLCLSDPSNALTDGHDGDINGDGQVSIRDVSCLLMMLKG